VSHLLGWRCFPWDLAARPGEEGSAEWLAPAQGTGRFDLFGEPPVLCLGESAAHAVAEVLQGFRGNRFHPAMLQRRGRPLAVAAFRTASLSMGALADLTDPSTLTRLGIRPDQVASHDRRTTQELSRRIHDADHAGLRWWSSLTGEWHTTVLFADRCGPVTWMVDAPSLLVPEHPALTEALRFLRIPVPDSAQGRRRRSRRR